MNLLPIAHAPTEIEIDVMGILLVALACLGQHGVSGNRGLDGAPWWGIVSEWCSLTYFFVSFCGGVQLL